VRRRRTGEGRWVWTWHEKGLKAAKGKNTGWRGLEGRGLGTSQGGEGEGGGTKRMRKREEEKGAPPIEREGGREGGSSREGAVGEACTCVYVDVINEPKAQRSQGWGMTSVVEDWRESKNKQLRFGCEG